MSYVAVEFPVFKINVGGQMEARQFDRFQNQYDCLWHSVVVLLYIKIKVKGNSF